jgi:Mg2+/Co2+ transporter CorB
MFRTIHVVRVVYLIIATSLSTALSFLVKRIFHLFGVSCAGASEVSSKHRTIHGMLKVHMGA